MQGTKKTTTMCRWASLEQAVCSFNTVNTIRRWVSSLFIQLPVSFFFFFFERAVLEHFILLSSVSSKLTHVDNTAPASLHKVCVVPSSFLWTLCNMTNIQLSVAAKAPNDKVSVQLLWYTNLSSVISHETLFFFSFYVKYKKCHYLQRAFIGFWVNAFILIPIETLVNSEGGGGVLRPLMKHLSNLQSSHCSGPFGSLSGLNQYIFIWLHLWPLCRGGSRLTDCMGSLCGSKQTFTALAFFFFPVLFWSHKAATECDGGIASIGLRVHAHQDLSLNVTRPYLEQITSSSFIRHRGLLAVGAVRKQNTHHHKPQR